MRRIKIKIFATPFEDLGPEEFFAAVMKRTMAALDDGSFTQPPRVVASAVAIAVLEVLGGADDGLEPYIPARLALKRKGRKR